MINARHDALNDLTFKYTILRHKMFWSCDTLLLLTKYEQGGGDESSSGRLRQLQHYEVGEDWEKGAQHGTKL